MPTTRERTKHSIDATGRIFGRLATEVATLLRGKHKPMYRPHLDVGDWVEIVNIKKLRFTGKKLSNTLKYRFSGYPGGLKTMTLGKLWDKDPEGTFRRAVKSMLPKNKLARTLLKRLIFTKTNDN